MLTSILYPSTVKSYLIHLKRDPLQKTLLFNQHFPLSLIFATYHMFKLYLQYFKFCFIYIEQRTLPRPADELRSSWDWTKDPWRALGSWKLGLKEQCHKIFYHHFFTIRISGTPTGSRTTQSRTTLPWMRHVL